MTADVADTGVRDFYDALAPHYHLLYPDWAQAVDGQGQALAALLTELGVPPGAAVLDAAAGIGTQTLGLAQRGYVLTAADLSPGAVQRLQRELTARGLTGQAFVDDLRQLAHAPDGAFDAVLACDNALPHLLSDADLRRALGQVWRSLRPGGVAVFSVRDYARIERVSPDVRPYGFRREGDSCFLAVQVWEWHGDQYDLRLYLTTEAADGRAHTDVQVTRYWAVTVDHLLALMRDTGFSPCERRDGVLFQPVLWGRKPS